MSRATILGIAGAVAGTMVLISFTLGLASMVREPGVESELVTGTIGSRPVPGPISEQPSAVLPLPTNQAEYPAPRTPTAAGVDFVV